MLADRVRMGSGKSEFKDIWGTPGSAKLIAGDGEEGFFGEVSSNELITGDALASQVGISQGTSQHSTAGWLKFAYKGEIQFVAKKTIRYSISWDAINTAKCVYGDSGDKTVTINGLTYKVTLMRGLGPSNDPKTITSVDSGEIVHHSEWNRLIAQIHEEAINKNWGWPNNIETDIGILEHSLGNGSQGMYNNEDLNIEGYPTIGGYSWCQEMGPTTQHHILRGGGTSYVESDIDSYAYYGWRPVLRLIR